MTHGLFIIIGRFFSRYPFELFINVQISQERCYYLGLVVVSAWLIAVIIGCTKHSNKRLITISRIFLLVCSKSASFFLQTDSSLPPNGHVFIWAQIHELALMALLRTEHLLDPSLWKHLSELKNCQSPRDDYAKTKKGKHFHGRWEDEDSTEVQLEGGRRENGKSQKGR